MVTASEIRTGVVTSWIFFSFLCFWEIIENAFLISNETAVILVLIKFMTVTSLFATFNAFLPADKENKERANSFLKYTNTFTFTVAGCLLLYNGILKENQSYQLVAVVIFAVGLVMTIKWWLKPIT